MQVGWPGLSRAIGATIVLTSTFWIALGVWLFRAHVAADHRTAVPAQHFVERQPPRSGLSIRQASGSGEGDASRVDAPVSTGMTYRSPQGLTLPVAGVAPEKLVDTFAQARAAGMRYHDAIDILSAEGTAVLAAAPGQVEKLFLSQDGGNTIYVRSSDRRTIYYYAHLSGYARDLREGMTVRGGQFLGTVGHTGNADALAPHLHFAVWIADPGQGWSQQGQAVDPYPLLTGKAAPPAPASATVAASTMK